MTCVSKNVDETVCLQYERRKEWIRQVRGEKLQWKADDWRRAPHLTNLLALLLPGRNE